MVEGEGIAQLRFGPAQIAALQKNLAADKMLERWCSAIFRAWRVRTSHTQSKNDSCNHSASLSRFEQRRGKLVG